MEYLFDVFQQDDEENDRRGEGSVTEFIYSSEDKENLYVSKKLFSKISKYLERIPEAVRCSEVCEEGWFNKKESYIQKRLKHKRKEGKYCLGISNMYRSFNGKRITRYLLYWLYERDVYYINKGMPPEPAGEMVPTDTLPRIYQIIDIDGPEMNGKG